MVWTVFEYLYRDADNHNSFGRAAFEDLASADQWHSAVMKMADGNLFIAEQVGLPTLYDQLYRWSGGAPTVADHCWHEYVSHGVFDESDLSTAIPKLGPVEAFVERLVGVESWNIWLSPNVTF